MATGTPLPTTNTGASAVSKTVGQLFGDVVTAAKAAAVVAQPWLTSWWFSPFFNALSNWVSGLLGGALGTASGMVYVDVQEYFALRTAASTLVKLQQAQKSGNVGAIQDANKNIDAAVAPVLHYIGDFHP